MDDGSPDRSGEICDSWAARDGRIRVIHQDNAGGGAARNAALDMAQGDLIAFVDSDDYIAPDMFEHLYGLLMQGASIAECGHVDAFNDNAVFGGLDAVRIYAVREAMAEHIRGRIFRQIIWNKLYRREVVGDIRFPVDKKIDDEFFTYQVLGKAQALIRSEKICYAYRQQASSVMHSMSAQKRLQGVEAKQQRHEYIMEHFPDLASLSLKDLWFTCLYQGQLALRKEAPEEITRTMTYLKDVLAAHPIGSVGCSAKERVWLTMAAAAFSATCRIRNLMKIGL